MGFKCLYADLLAMFFKSIFSFNNHSSLTRYDYYCLHLTDENRDSEECLLSHTASNDCLSQLRLLKQNTIGWGLKQQKFISSQF